MKLTKENSKIIKIGDIVKFTYPSSSTSTGVVYGTPTQGDWGILCHRSDGSLFGYGEAMFTGEIEFEILDNNKPKKDFNYI